jgi:hypothetical protein
VTALRDIGRAALLGVWLGAAIAAGYVLYATVRSPALITDMQAALLAAGGVLALVLAVYTAWPSWIRSS